MGCQMWMVLIAVMAVAGMTVTEAQDTPSCAQSLVPCASYLNSTSPPESCCKPIKDAVATQLECLCNLYNTPGLLESFGVSVADALRLTKACGVDPNTSSCSKVSAPSPTAAAAVPPPGSVAGNGAASMMAWTAISTLLLSAASVMLY